MPDLNLLYKAAQEDTIAYGNKFIRYDLISSPYIGAGHLPPKPQTKRNLEVCNTSTEVQEDQKVLINDWSENKDPFTQANLLDNEDDQVQELIFQIRKSLSITYQKSLANRLITLFNDAKEEESDSLGIAVGSLRNFYNFFRLHDNLKYPTISLTPDNNIYSSWRGEHNQVFSVHFLPNEDARFVIFKPNDKHPERKIRLSGTATTDTLMKTVESSGVWDWIAV